MGPGRELTQVTPSLLTARPAPPGRRQIGPGCAAAMGQQGAQERHGCRRRLSAEDALRGTALRTRGSYRGTMYGLCGAGACTLSGFRGCQRRPARPVLGSQCSYPPLRSGAHVSPSQICYCSRGLAVSERPPKFSLISPFVPGRGPSPGLLVLCQRPLPPILLPHPPFTALVLALGFWLGSRTF